MKQVRFYLQTQTGRESFTTYCESVVRKNMQYALEAVRFHTPTELADYLETCLKTTYDDGDAARQILEEVVKQQFLHQ